MFHRLLSSFAIVSFALAILFISFFKTIRPPTVIGSSLDTMVSSPSGSIDYYLPYPGLLPDHPLYWLKMVRDRVRLWLAFNQTKKAELLLLYADKRLGAAKALAEGNKVALAITTATKAETYLNQVLVQLESLDQEKEEVKALWQKASISALKHVEIISSLTLQVPDEAKATLSKMAAQTQELVRQAQGTIGNSENETETEIDDQEGLEEENNVEDDSTDTEKESEEENSDLTDEDAGELSEESESRL